MFHSMGLPKAEDLLAMWRNKADSKVNCADFLKSASMPWSELDNFLKYLDGFQLRRRIQITPSSDQAPTRSSYDDLRFYTDDPPPWNDVILGAEQLEEIREFKKTWTNTFQIDLAQTTEEYRLLLNVAAMVIDFDPGHLMHRVHYHYEHAHLYNL
jgi:hypothetical protein